MLPGLTRDLVTIAQPATTADAEGFPSGTLGTALNTMGALGTPRAKDQAVAAQRGQTVDAVLIVDPSVSVKLGGIVTARGFTWIIVAVTDVRVHQRVLLRHA